MELEALRTEIARLFQDGSVASFVLSSPASKGADSCRKIAGRTILLRGKPAVQLERFCGQKTTHVNLPRDQAAGQVLELLSTTFRQAHFRTKDGEVNVRIGKDGRVSVSRKRGSEVPLVAATHDRGKAHLIPEGEPCPFLHQLGVMTEEGRVVASHRDKFRQVNRFLDIVSSALDSVAGADSLRVVDYGCGKAYLTFAIHHFLTNIRGRAAEVIGIDRREDVIATCREVAAKLSLDSIHFEVGDIHSAAAGDRVDIVVALHACDTATDEALARAVQMSARVILAAPCCQHELNRQLDNEAVRAMLKHGIIREKLTGLVTDSLRASLLEAHGYRTALMEFIDPEHTPKNILLKATKTEIGNTEALREYQTLRDFWHVRPTLERLLDHR